MGFLSFAALLSSPPSPTARTTTHDVSFDLTTIYPPRKMPPPRASRAPSSSLHIPMEVVLAVIEAAYYDENFEANEKLLKDCALVCRNWAAPAQKLLFRNVTLRTETAYSAFQGAVNRSTAHGRMLGDAVVRMRVVLDHNQPFNLSHRSFAHAVTLCPNLYELNLALFGCGAPGQDVIGIPDASRMRRLAPSFDQDTLTLLASGPCITALQFSNWSENHQSLNQLLDVWPTIKSLVISGTAPKITSPSTGPFPGTLEELRMNFQQSPSLLFMKWLLHNSSNTLRILELEREPSSEILDYFVHAHSTTLESLALPVCGSREHALAVQRCEELKEFKIENAWASPMVYRKLPGVLQHIALGLDRDTALQPVIEAVKARVSVRAVTVHIWDGGEHHPQIPALKTACACLGIDLRFTRDIRVFRNMTRGDPVPHQSFPRSKTLDNLQFMSNA